MATSLPRRPVALLTTVAVAFLLAGGGQAHADINMSGRWIINFFGPQPDSCGATISQFNGSGLSVTLSNCYYQGTYSGSITKATGQFSVNKQHFQVFVAFGGTVSGDTLSGTYTTGSVNGPVFNGSISGSLVEPFVGGVAELPEIASSTAEASGTSGSDASVVAGMAVASAILAAVLGTVAWRVRVWR